MKTIKQIADELGVSKTAVRKKIENLGLSEKVQTNGNRIEVDERQERLIKLAFSQKETKTINANEVSEKSETLRLLSSMVSTLQEQLQEKDRQIERLQTELENAQKSVNQAQQLHAMTEQKLLLIEDKQEQEEQPKKWWQFWK
uniref:Helix-turn-helix type 11 domain-containing protein n=1 Tax=uncultured prokaryote TaxID=198431 RepID=A0A0H5Q4N7_9ZZZZ|nr:hypothetical protein [uncultured prokaryote]